MNNEEPKKPTPKPSSLDKKVFDVMRPGKTPASANSRNVIVGHKPQIKDDQFVPGANSRVANNNPFNDHELMNSAEKVDLKPTSDGPEKAPTTDTAPILDKPSEVAPAQKVAEKALAKEETKPSEPATTPSDDELLLPAKIEPLVHDIDDGETTPELMDFTPDANAEEVITEATPDEVAADVEQKPTPEQLAVGVTVETDLDTEEKEEAAQPEPAHDEPIPQGKVMTSDELMAATNAPLLDHAVVSHHKRHIKWWEWVLIFLLIVILAAVAIDLLIDAKVITTGFDVPHTNFIK